MSNIKIYGKLESATADGVLADGSQIQHMTGVSVNETLESLVSGKVDKVDGKGLSTNDYTSSEKTKLSGIATGATKVEESTVSGWGFTKNGGTVTSVAVKMNGATKGTVTTTGTIDLGSVATLGSDGKVPSSQLPSYVDDVLEYENMSDFPASGETGKIYIAKNTNKTYRWGGSAYVEISESLALGVTSSTAFRGDWGRQTQNDLQSHIESTSNPHVVTKTQVGLGNVDNTSDLNKPISTAVQRALDLKADKSDFYTLDLTLSAASSLLEYTGTAASDVISWTVKYNGVTATPDTISLKVDGTAVTVSVSGTSYTASINKLGSTSIVLTVTKGGKTATKTIHVTMARKNYFGFAGSSITGLSSLTAQSLVADPKGTYTLTNSTSGSYMWLCVGSDKTISMVTSSGFEIPMEAASTTSVTGYNCYRSSNALAAGQVKFTIS